MIRHALFVNGAAARIGHVFKESTAVECFRLRVLLDLIYFRLKLRRASAAVCFRFINTLTATLQVTSHRPSLGLWSAKSVARAADKNAAAVFCFEFKANIDLPSKV